MLLFMYSSWRGDGLQVCQKSLSMLLFSFSSVTEHNIAFSVNNEEAIQ